MLSVFLDDYGDGLALCPIIFHMSIPGVCNGICSECVQKKSHVACENVCSLKCRGAGCDKSLLAVPLKLLSEYL